MTSLLEAMHVDTSAMKPAQIKLLEKQVASPRFQKFLLGMCPIVVKAAKATPM
jgi:hypothetical protein